MMVHSILINGIKKLPLSFQIGSEIRVDNSSHVPHCSPPVGTTDGRISVEHKDGQWSQLTSVRCRVATKIFEDFGERLCKEINIGQEPVSIVHQTWP